MTARAHARRGVLGRWTRRRTAPGPGLAAAHIQEGLRRFAEDIDAASAIVTAAQDRASRQPWDTAEMPAVPAAERPVPGTGPGSLDALYAAADLRDQRRRLADEYAAWYGWHVPPDIPQGRVRPYAPENEPEPAPDVTYPAPDLHADLAECPAFRDTVRACLVRREHARGGRRPGPWLEEYADVYRASTAPVPGFQFGGAS